jgi:hemoglobin-like flavoprotein
MSPESRHLVETTWARVVPVSEAAAALFYERLFTLDPELRTLFAGTEMPEQHRKLVNALNMAVRALGNLDAARPSLESLGRLHVRYGVEASHYDTVGAALLWTLEQGLGEAWTDEVEAAWTELYDEVAGTMKAAAYATARG